MNEGHQAEVQGLQEDPKVLEVRGHRADARNERHEEEDGVEGVGDEEVELGDHRLSVRLVPVFFHLRGQEIGSVVIQVEVVEDLQVAGQLRAIEEHPEGDNCYGDPAFGWRQLVRFQSLVVAEKNVLKQKTACSTRLSSHSPEKHLAL